MTRYEFRCVCGEWVEATVEGRGAEPIRDDAFCDLYQAARWHLSMIHGHKISNKKTAQVGLIGPDYAKKRDAIEPAVREYRRRFGDDAVREVD